MKDPYVYGNTNILVNKADIKNQSRLDEYETIFCNIAIIEMLKNPIKINGPLDIFLIHEKLFKEVYDWAGKPRKINIYKEEQILDGLSVNYSDYVNIKKDLNNIQNDINELLKKDNPKEMIHLIAVIISKIWQVHAFREGNTRAVCIFLYFLLKKCNLKLNVNFIDEHSKFFRNALVLASIGEYSEFEYLESILLDAVTLKIKIIKKDKYKDIKGYKLDKYVYNYHRIKNE